MSAILPAAPYDFWDRVAREVAQLVVARQAHAIDWRQGMTAHPLTGGVAVPASESRFGTNPADAHRISAADLAGTGRQ